MVDLLSHNQRVEGLKAIREGKAAPSSSQYLQYIEIDGYQTYPTLASLLVCCGIHQGSTFPN